jgi:hypothetical protein
MTGEDDVYVKGDVEIDGALYVDGFLYGNGSKLTGIIGGTASGWTTDGATETNTNYDVNIGGDAQIDGSLYLDGGIYLQGQTSDSLLKSSAGYGIDIVVSGTNEAISVASNGYVGIGSTAPSYKLDVNGTGRFGGAGNVGIGTISPKVSLEVGNSSLTSVSGVSYSVAVTGSMEIDNNIYVDKSIYLTSATASFLYMKQPDSGCSKCGVDASSTWSCVDTTCPGGM